MLFRSDRGEVIFSTKSSLRKELEKVAAGVDWPYLQYSRTYRILSVVGPYLSVEDCLVYANPGAYTAVHYRTIDLDNPSGTPARLDQLFKQQDILQALLADKVIGRILHEIGNTAVPATLGDLIKTLTEHNQGNEADYLIDEYWLSSFALHHLEKGKVAVRVALPYRKGMREQSLKQIGLLLPASSKLQTAFLSAGNLSEGFLMKDAEKISRGHPAKIQLDAPQ